MTYRLLKLTVILAAISLTGVVFTQTFWLKRSVKISEKQYDDRVDRMLDDVKDELKEVADTSFRFKNINKKNLTFFEVLDTAMLSYLFDKYTSYHRLDRRYYYAILRSSDDSLIYRSPGFRISMEHEASKTCLSCIWKKRYMHLSVFFPDKKKNIYHEMLSWILLSVIFLFTITGAFAYIVYSMVKQKKITEIKNDFINNMTHEFKTPISTISLSSEILIKNADKPVSDSIKKYAGIIYDENQRMRSQVELVLQTAMIDRGQLVMRKEEVNLNELIQSVVDSFCLDINEKEPYFEYNFNTSNPVLKADIAHIRNVISNIIDNAVKYSGENPSIAIETENTENGIKLAVTDKGIGMSRESQKKIFEKFYRVSTGNVHNVKGFGLGLYYVKTIVEAHQGSVIVQSSLNNGSTFIVFLPLE